MNVEILAKHMVAADDLLTALCVLMLAITGIVFIVVSVLRK